MRRLAVLLLATCAFGQTHSRQSQTVTYDLNGRAAPEPSVSVTGTEGSTVRVERTQSVNGRSVPVDSVEEKVLSESPEGRVVERMIRRYDQNGQPGTVEKVRIEEAKTGDGSVTTLTTVYQTDLNGSLQLTERMKTTSLTSGDTTVSDVAVERPNINGSLDAAERRKVVVRADEKSSESDTTVFRRDSNGNFSAAAREVARTATEDGLARTSVTEYNVAAGSGGKLELAGQREIESRVQPDGSTVTVTSVFGTTNPGRAISGYTSGPRLREQQIVERKATGDGGFVETFSVRRTQLDSERLGPAHKISQTSCAGNCLPPPAPKK